MLLDNLPDTSNQFNAIFQEFSDLILILDQNGTILDHKTSDVNLLYPSPEVLRGALVQNILPAEAGEKFLSAFQQVKSQQVTSSLEYSLMIAGQKHWVEGRLVPTSEIQYVLVVRDITQHKHMEEKNRRQLKRLAALRAIDLAISSSLDLNLVLSVVLSQVLAQLSVDAADILLLNSQNNCLEFAHGVGFRTEALRHTCLQMGKGYAGTAALKREVISVPNLQHRKAGFLGSPRFAEEGFYSYFGIPLIAKGKVRGVLEMFHRTPLDPDPDWIDFMETLAGQAAIAVENAILLKELQRTNFELTLAYNTTIEGWSRALDLRDRDTEGHTLRVTDLALKLAQRLGLSEAELIHIRRGAILHDIGKMAVPDSILLKPGPLTGEEWDVIRQHPRYAFELLSPIPHLGSAIDIPHYHHEKWDGTGYPHGLKEDQIPLNARLFAVVDVYDALTSDRSYRPAWTKEKAIEYIRDQTGRHFDPNMAGVFLKMIEIGN
jgi:PAS domain S-box-containing protein/putative nucleotidyltransferase with HDIG domain